MACEVCKFKEMCGGCVPGTDAKAPARLERLKGMGFSCSVLECAMNRKVDYCLRCEDFPCDVHYQAGLPYSKKLLDTFKRVLKK
jgi:hypothetical protein